MSAALKMSYRLNCKGLHNVIFSRVSGFGRSHCVLRGGPMTDQSGQAVALASLSARQAKVLGLMTSGTFGPHGSILSRAESDVIALSLGSRLQARMGGLGSILYRVTCKHWITDAGQLIPALRALGHRSSGKDSTGWVRPAARDHKDTPGMPYDPDGSGRVEMRQTVSLACWPRPQAGNPGTETYNPAGNTDSSRKTQAIALTVEYRFTPSSIGEMPTGSCVVIPTDRVSGPLNPAHSLWLMLGPFGTAWLRCAERVTPLTSRKRRASSKQ